MPVSSDERKAYYRAWRAEQDPVKIRRYSREWWAARTPEQRERYAEYRRQYYQANKDQVRAITRRNKLRRKYGITPEHYEHMLKDQDGLCAICRQTEPRGSYRVDHCHKTGKVRGLLCHKCNAGIGMLRDDPEILERGVAYLKKAA